MQGNGEGQHAPGVELLAGVGDVEQAAAAAVDVGLAGGGDGEDDLAPVAHDPGHLGKKILAGEPLARLPEIVGGGLVAVDPVAGGIEDLHQHVGADGEADAGVEEVAGVDDDGNAAALGLEGAKGGAVASERSGQVILLGVAICLAAIVVSGMAGYRKERELGSSHGAVREFSYRKGLLVAIFAGAMSACFAYGLAAAKPIDLLAQAQLAQHNRSDLWQHLPGLVVVLWGGFTTNFLWCAILLVKNRSAAQFAGRTMHGRIAPRVLALNIAASAAAGLLWYLQFFFYSMGQTKMGRYDFSSWTLHMAGTILFATLWGVVLHEWRGTGTRTKALGTLGFSLLVLSTIVVGYGNYLKAH